MASAGNDVASSNSNLSAPTGWTKKEHGPVARHGYINPKKIGLSRREVVVFLSPNGDEIKSKRQLELYLKNHPGGPSISEFDWSAGDGPRRSTRLSEKPGGTWTPVSEPSRKRQKKSDSKKGEKRQGDGVDGEDEVSELKEDEATRENAKPSENVETIDMEDADDKNKGEASIQEVLIAGSSDIVSMPETEKVLRDPQNLENQKAASDTVVVEQEDVANTLQAAVEMAGNKEDSASQMAEVEASSKLETEEVDDKITADIHIEESVKALQQAPELKKDCENAAKAAETEAPSKLESEGADKDSTLDAMEAQVRSDSLVKLGLEENKVEPEKQPSEKESSCEVDAKVGKEFKAADAEQGNSHDKEVST